MLLLDLDMAWKVVPVLVYVIFFFFYSYFLTPFSQIRYIKQRSDCSSVSTGNILQCTCQRSLADHALASVGEILYVACIFAYMVQLKEKN